MYSEAVLDHFPESAQTWGTLDTANGPQFRLKNPVCGDILELSARMEDRAHRGSAISGRADA